MERGPTTKEEDAAGSPTGRGTRRIGLRHVLAGLGLAAGPTSDDDLARLLRELTGRSAGKADVGRVLRADARAYARNAGLCDPWPLPALAADTLTPLDGLLTRSDWPLEWRLIAGRSLRVAHLRTTLALVGRARWARLEARRGPALVGLLRRYSSSVAGAVHFGEGLDLDRIQRAVEAELAEVEPGDLIERRAATMVLGALSPPFQRWGRPHIVTRVQESDRRIAR
jgi:hypothetical protein